VLARTVHSRQGRQSIFKERVHGSTLTYLGRESISECHILNVLSSLLSLSLALCSLSFSLSLFLSLSLSRETECTELKCIPNPSIQCTKKQAVRLARSSVCDCQHTYVLAIVCDCIQRMQHLLDIVVEDTMRSHTLNASHAPCTLNTVYWLLDIQYFGERERERESTLYYDAREVPGRIPRNAYVGAFVHACLNVCICARERETEDWREGDWRE
jgi:hypothetical protein